MFSEHQKNIAYTIGQFYFQKHESIEKANEEIERVGFEDIQIIVTHTCQHCKLDNFDVEITVKRPDVFIGKRGENVTELEKFLKVKIKIKEAETKIEEFIYLQDFEEYLS